MLAVREELPVKAGGVTRLRPEAERSIPEQGEARIISGGGLKRYCAYMHSSDLGIGAKDQSSLAIAGSSQSGPQASLTRGSVRGRATDLIFRRRDPSVSSQTPNAHSP